MGCAHCVWVRDVGSQCRNDEWRRRLESYTEPESYFDGYADRYADEYDHADHNPDRY
jgi:hypothetical protein